MGMSHLHHFALVRPRVVVPMNMRNAVVLRRRIVFRVRPVAVVRVRMLRRVFVVVYSLERVQSPIP